MKTLKRYYRASIVFTVAIASLTLGLIVMLAETTTLFNVIEFILVKLIALIFVLIGVLLLKIMVDYYNVEDEFNG